MPIVLISGSLNLLELAGPFQACNGIPLHFLRNRMPLTSLSVRYNVLTVVNINNNVMSSGLVDKQERFVGKKRLPLSAR